MTFDLIILAGIILDTLFGDPYFLPHPIRYIGKLISTLEKMLLRVTDSGGVKKIKGGILVFLTVSLTYLFYFYVIKIAFNINIYVAVAVQIFMIYQMLAGRCLADEGIKIYNSLKVRDMGKARQQIGYLVSRDTDVMEEEDVVKATIETVSENIIDGIISPLLYVFIGGVPLGMAYKAINTMDSMIGYKNDKYTDFGFVAAKLDDVFNYLPARITGVFLIIAGFFNKDDYKNGYKIMIRDRKNHASPNSPYAEATMAGLLGIQLGGKASYFGVMSEKPTFGDLIKKISYRHIKETVKLMYFTYFLGYLCFDVVYMILN